MKSHVSGDTFALSHPAPPDTASVDLVIAGPSIEIIAAVVADGTATISVTSLTLPTGTFEMYLEFTNSTGNRSTVPIGDLTVKQDPRLQIPSDRTPHAERTLNNVEAVLEGRATSDILSYQLNGRSLSRIPIEELREWRDALRSEVAAKRARKLGPGRVNVKI